jgi:hypothetical protein
VSVRHLFKPLMIAVAACGTAGCATYAPWDLPDPYSSGSAASPYYYGGGGYGYGSYYRGGYYGDPYYDPYYRGGVRLPYPVYGYPYYPGHSCWDRNHDGRCDGRGGGGGDGDDDAGNGGQPRPKSDRPLKDVRRLFRDREQERGARVPGSAPNTALGSVPSAVEGGSGKAPKASAPARMQTPPSPPRRVESRRPVEASAPRRAPRDDGATRGPRAPRDDVTGGRPLR